ncbi:SRPBCC family protein [Tsukamurella sp. 8F]|uniref:SRPBCC family protein n=1 Tax=unclassified Tsukamurella TaxID=2633480 RepID=UPI0023B8D968|nr:MULTISPECIES: SRPBCC family protein [unclassified Tsukamurella]MDF0529458.1 SRPBCC family protein [Tsukamurella sp. 8J]MDF0585854.1 SRPBCC family protein [Tsukamurella sp. 8F]
MASPVLESTIVIDAPAEKVWKVVSDLQAMSKRSPQCRKVIVRGGDIGLGTKMINVNRKGWRVWPTNTVVTAFDENEKVAFRVVENNTTWSYTLVPDGDRTTVVERREAPNGKTSAASAFLISTLMGGTEPFERELLVGMKQTLAAIKTEAEAD